MGSTDHAGDFAHRTAVLPRPPAHMTDGETTIDVALVAELVNSSELTAEISAAYDHDGNLVATNNGDEYTDNQIRQPPLCRAFGPERMVPHVSAPAR